MASKRDELLEYDWRLDGEDAVFCVDLALYNGAPNAGYPILAYVGCSPRKEDRELSGGDIRHMVAFCAKCRRRLDLLMAGYIETAKIRQYYFYVASKADYDALKLFAEKERSFTCRVGGKKEEDWASYFRILYPDAAKYQTVRNEEIIAQHYELGDSDAPRRLNLHFAFLNEPVRRQFEEAARSEGFAIGGYEEFDGNELPCGVILHRISAFKKSDVDAVTVQAIRIAEKFNGKLLFWDCPIVPGRGA